MRFIQQQRLNSAASFIYIHLISKLSLDPYFRKPANSRNSVHGARSGALPD